MTDQYRNTYHVAVIGAGIGGLSAARTLAGQGLDIILIDENPHMGGQFLRQPFWPDRRDAPGIGHIKGHPKGHVTGHGARSRLPDRILQDPMVRAGTALAGAISVPGAAWTSFIRLRCWAFSRTGGFGSWPVRPPVPPQDRMPA